MVKKDVSMSLCRSCNAKIIWITLTSGKKMPCNPEKVHSTEAEQGGVIVTEDGKVVQIPHNIDPDVHGYISHFATCPQAMRWRNSPRIFGGAK